MKICSACEGRGKSTSGRRCPICRGVTAKPATAMTSETPEKLAKVIAALRALWEEKGQAKQEPTPYDATKVVLETMQPKEFFVAVQLVGMTKRKVQFAGPVSDVSRLLDQKPPHKGQPAFIVRQAGSGGRAKPAYKWAGGKWVAKKPKA